MLLDCSVKMTLIESIKAVGRRVARVAALGAVFSAVYFVIGSYLYPAWFYDFAWHEGFLDFNESAYSLLGQVHEYPFTTASILLTLFIVALVIARYRGAVFALIDACWGRIVLGSAIAIAITSLTAYGLHKKIYDVVDAFKQSEPFALDESFLAPKQQLIISPPIDFVYLDVPSVDTLYNEIEPDLIEKIRIEGRASNVEGKAGIEGGIGSVSLGGNKERESKTTSERVEFSTPRKCLFVMTYARDNKKAPFLSDYDDWKSISTRASLQEAGKSPITKESIEKLRLQTEREIEAINTNALRHELSTLEGVIFLKGKFKRESQGSGNQVLTTEFSAKPHVDLRVLVPSVSPLPVNAYLTVFGRVTKPLGGDGTVEVRAIAVF